MNSRLFPVLLIAFILLAGLIIYIDKKIILPQRKLKMPDVQEVRMSENNMKASDIDAYFNTKEEIKKRGEIKEKIAVGNNVPAKQNPFLFPEEILLL
ncbi:MAG: hypothetical protein KAR45_23295, partial [Desulfobacteraceae bacterium]|nr:hypothetical protein [Desulfobacteraceae bacterium]